MTSQQRKKRLCSLRLITSVAMLIGFWVAVNKLPNFESSRFTPGLLGIVCFTSFVPLALSVAVLKDGTVGQKWFAAFILIVAAAFAFFAQYTLRAEIRSLDGP